MTFYATTYPPLHISGRRGRPQLTHTLFFFHLAKAFDKLYLSALHFLLYLRFTGTNLWRRKSKRKGLTVVRNPSASPSSTSFAIVLTWSQVNVLSQALDNLRTVVSTRVVLQQIGTHARPPSNSMPRSRSQSCWSCKVSDSPRRPPILNSQCATCRLRCRR